jgi:ATP-dependent Clp protease protease subunit
MKNLKDIKVAPGRTILIAGEITTETFTSFLNVFEHVDRTKGPIALRIMSEGGEVPAGFAIFDRVKLSKNPIVTEGYGIIASMAVLLFQLGKIRRIAPSARLMIHNASTEIEGRFENKDFKRTHAELKVIDSMYNKLVSERSGMDAKKLDEMCDKETYLSAREAVSLGLADEILGIDILEQKEEPKKGKKK